MDGTLLVLLGSIFIIPVTVIIYIFSQTFNNSEKDNTVNPNFKKNNSDEE